MDSDALNHDPFEHFRVLRVIARMNVGGPAVQIGGLMAELPSRGFDGVLLTGRPGEDEDELIHPDIRACVRRIEPLGRRVRLFGDVMAFLAIVQEIRRFKPHIVHTHTAKAGALGRLAAMITGVPVVVHTYHGHVLHGYFGPRLTRVVIWVERWLARRTSVLVSVGSRVRDELLQAGIGRPDQFRVVAPGVRPPSLTDRQSAREELGIAPNAFVVTWVGRIVPIKRFDRFVEMAVRLKDEIPGVHFLVAGGGDLETARTDAARLGNQITFAGWMLDPGPAYSASDVVVLTSDNEGMPVSLIEAQMCGLPVVAVDVGSVREVVNDRTGYVVDKSADALAQGVIDVAQARLETDPVATRAWAEDRFSVGRLVDSHVEMYRDALRQAGLTDV